MKTILTLLLSCFLLSANGKSTYEKLSEVNACWTAQPDINAGMLQVAQHPRNEKEWIKLHLSLVEHTLRNRKPSNLGPAQQQARLQALDNLHDYWTAGSFPINEDYAKRTPIFIDRHNNFCAVGYLIKASGREALARMIAAKTNLAYVNDMPYAALDAWAAENGLSKDELAWIQPGYPVKESVLAIGKGVNGEVRELLAYDDTLYVGGNFTKADSTLDAANITYITEDGGTYTWHTMGSGVNGPVNAIANFNNRVYIAGAFSMAGDSVVNNIAYWENGRWNFSGCLYGEVKDLVVFGNALYAAGSFDVCAARTDINFARLEGTQWQQLPGLSGRINTMEVWDTTLLLGGAFAYQQDTVNAIKWTSATGFNPFTKSIRNEVNDFELFNDTVYAGCKWMQGGDSTHLFLKLRNSSWDTTFGLSYGQNWQRYWSPGVSFNTLLGEQNHLMLGGRFSGAAGMTGVFNCIDLTPSTIAGRYYYGNGSWFGVDGPILKMTYFKGYMIAGGNFKLSFPRERALNGIAKREIHAETIGSVKAMDDLFVFPNPADAGSWINVTSGFKVREYMVMNTAGQVLSQGSEKGQTPIKLRAPMTSGIYFLKLKTSANKTVTRKIVVE